MSSGQNSSSAPRSSAPGPVLADGITATGTAPGGTFITSADEQRSAGTAELTHWMAEHPAGHAAGPHAAGRGDGRAARPGTRAGLQMARVTLSHRATQGEQCGKLPRFRPGIWTRQAGGTSRPAREGWRR